MRDSTGDAASIRYRSSPRLRRRPIGARRPGARAREGHGADLGLCELAVVLEPGVGEARRQGHDPRVGRAGDLEGPRRSGGRRRSSRTVGRGARRNALARAAHRLEDVIVEAPKPRSLNRAASRAGSTRPMTAPGSGRPAGGGESFAPAARPCRLTQAHSGKRPAEPRRRKAEGGDLREAYDLVGGDEAGEFGADAEMEGVAGRQHADRAAASGEDRPVASRDGAGPGSGSAGKRSRKREMPLPPTTNVEPPRARQAPPARARRGHPRRCR